ncbi:MAG: CHAT domain-containing protein [Planctomycetota bacterium]|jgi:CHAT domain-containing protein
MTLESPRGRGGRAGALALGLALAALTVGLFAAPLSAQDEPAVEEPAERVFLVPDAALAALPFAALPGSGSGRFLLDELELVYLPTAQAIVPWGGAEASTGKGLLAIGNVDYEAPSAPAVDPQDQQPADPERPDSGLAFAPSADLPGRVRTLRGSGGRVLRFKPLPGTGREMVQVAKRFRAAWPTEPVDIRSSAAASEEAVRLLGPGRRVVHLATHEFVRDDHDSALELSRRGKSLEVGLARHVAGFDPLVLTGLAFAGANATERTLADDGILTALEAGHLDLDGVEMVVLSACDTARGTVRAGEGVVGLVRGFTTAGAETVVASLWPVDDAATSVLMGELYANSGGAGDGLRVAQALRQGALRLRATESSSVDRGRSLAAGRRVGRRARPFEAPRHWAAFVAYGAQRR